jgi:hypothetical protein
MESKCINARNRTFDPHLQLAGSVAKFSTRLNAPHMLHVNETMQPYFATGTSSIMTKDAGC